MKLHHSRTRARIACATALFLLGVLPLQGAAQVPGQVDFQGLLLDTAGDPVNGLVDLDFALFDAATGGTALWSELHADVSVVDGVYDVTLGSGTPLTPALLATGDMYLEISVEGETLSPRRQLLAVPYALRAAEAESLDGLPGAYFTEMLHHFDFDGGSPENLDPQEGLGDTDGDGVANFIDPDNDGDGLSDQLEVSQGSDINVVTPDITGFSPPSALAAFPATLTVNGTTFEPGMSVQFGAETPTPTNLTPTSFDVSVSAVPVGDASVVVTIPNGQSASASYPRPASLAIAGFSPPSAPAAFPATLTVSGTSFQSGMTVQVGAETPTPTNITSTSFDVSLSAAPVGDSTVTITLPNGEIASTSYSRTASLAISGLDPPGNTADVTLTVTVTGTGFAPGLVVDAFGSETPAPMNLTPTSFQVQVGPQAAGVVPVEISIPNGETASSSFEFRGYRWVIVTSPTGGSFGGLAGADALCTVWAENSGLASLTFLPWLADATESPATRFFQSSVPYIRRIDSSVVADDWADLVDGSLDIAITPVGGASWANVALPSATGTGTNCSNWTSGSAAATGRGGNGALISSAWTDAVDAACNQPRILYCFEQ